MPLPVATRSVLWSIAIAWLALVGAGFALAMRADLRQGAVGTVPASWPASIALSRHPTGPTMVVALHPQCPCSTATLDTLEDLLSFDGPSDRRVLLLFRAEAGGANVAHTDLWKRAGSLPVERMADVDGRLADTFGALTSGMVVVFDATGRAGYRGGLTPGRGQRADAVRTRLAASVWAPPGSVVDTPPVYGCALRGADRVTS